MSELSTAHAVDTEYFVRRGMTKGYEYASLLTPPLYTAFVFARRGRGYITTSRFLRATWVGGGVGIAGGGAFEYVRAAYADDKSLRARRLRTSYNAASIRADDHATIGSVLFAILTPAVFWKRANVIHLILGGAGIGAGVGSLTHWGRTISGDRPGRF